MADARNDNAATALFLALESAQVFSMVNPSIFTIRRFPDEHTLEDIRTGEAIAGGVILTTALVVAAVLDSPLPIVVAAIYVAVFIGIYEYAIATSRQRPRNPIDQQGA